MNYLNITNNNYNYIIFNFFTLKWGYGGACSPSREREIGMNKIEKNGG